MPVQVVDVAADVEAGVRRQRGRVDARPCDDDHAQVRHEPLRLRVRGDDAPQQVPADAGSADRDDADPLVVAVAQLRAHGGRVRNRRRVEARDVADEVEVLARPVPDARQLRAEHVGHDVAGVADEQRAVAQAREPGDLLDHLGVVVGGQRGLAVAAVGHRQPADEVGQPDVRRALEFGVLVQEVVEVPRLVAHPRVVGPFLDQVGEHHEVVDEDLVHPPDGLERVQVVLGGFRLDVRRLVRQMRRRGMDVLAAPLQQLGERMLGQPVHLDVRTQLAQLVGDRDVAAGMAKADRRGQVQDAAPAVDRPRPATRRRRRHWRQPRNEFADRLVDDDGFARLRQMSRSGKGKQLPAGELDDEFTALVRLAAVTVAVNGEDGALDPAKHRLGFLLARRGDRTLLVHDQRLRSDVHRPANCVLGLLRRVRLAEQLAEEELREAAPVPQPVVPVLLVPALVDVELGLEAGCVRAMRDRRREVRRPGRDRDDAEHAFGIHRRGEQGPPAARAQPDQHGALDADRVHDRDRVFDELGVRVRGDVGGPVGAPVAPRVDGDDPGSPREVGHLRLPRPGVHDRVDRDEYDGRIPLPEHLVADLDTVAFDEALDVRISRTHRVPLWPVAPTIPWSIAARLQRARNGSGQPRPSRRTGRRDHGRQANGHRRGQAERVPGQVRHGPGRGNGSGQRRRRAPARAVRRAGRRTGDRGRTGRADGDRPALRRRVAAWPGGRRLRRVRRGRRLVLDDGGAGVRTRESGRRRLRAGGVRAGARGAARRVGDRGPLPLRRRLRLARARRGRLRRLRAVLPPGLHRESRAVVDSRAGRCRRQAARRRARRRRRLRARRVFRAARERIPAVDGERLGLPRPVDRARAQASRRRGRGRSRIVRGGARLGVLRIGVRPGHDVRLPA